MPKVIVPKGKPPHRAFEGKFTHDSEVDAAYINLNGSRRAKVAKTVEINANVYADFDKKDRLVGIEILNSTHLPPVIKKILRNLRN